KDEEIRPEPLLRGGDLIALGLKPGPIFTDILRQAEDAQLGGELQSREEALQWLQRNYGNRG
ncbi:MAG TPA: CCA tRNA nucleotidyltransferase, partial [Verrucomicrobiae bacterium]|nr:CCA tRNA nucleotidyltransferase [Verrucomicrobiae bacterium]